MSNILSDKHRQSIARSAITSCSIRTYADVGCYQGASMTWYATNFPDLNLYGCDLNAEAIVECRARVPGRPLLFQEDSRMWLESVDLPEPVLFYLDTDWVIEPPGTPPRKQQELDIIFGRFKRFVVIANSVNNPDHHLCGQNGFKPETVAGIFDRNGKHCRQFLSPRYKHPELANGYVVMNCCGVTGIPFDGEVFEDLCDTGERP